MVNDIDEKYLKLEEAKEIAKYRIIKEYIVDTAVSTTLGSFVYGLADIFLHLHKPLSPYYHPLIAVPFGIISAWASFLINSPNHEEIFQECLKKTGYVNSSSE
jgi:hypothetical protein